RSGLRSRLPAPPCNLRRRAVGRCSNPIRRVDSCLRTQHRSHSSGPEPNPPRRWHKSPPHTPCRTTLSGETGERRARRPQPQHGHLESPSIHREIGRHGVNLNQQPTNVFNSRSLANDRNVPKMRVRTKFIAITLFVATVPLLMSASQSIRLHERTLNDILLQLHATSAELGAQAVQQHLDQTRGALSNIVQGTIHWASLAARE